MLINKSALKINSRLIWQTKKFLHRQAGVPDVLSDEGVREVVENVMICLKCILEFRTNDGFKYFIWKGKARKKIHFYTFNVLVLNVLHQINYEYSAKRIQFLIKSIQPCLLFASMLTTSVGSLEEFLMYVGSISRLDAT